MSADKETRKVLWLAIGEYRGRTLSGFFVYAQARQVQYMEELMYRVYVTDALQKITENTANFAGGHIMPYRFYDAVYGNGKEKEKESAEEIVRNVTSKAGLEVTI